MHLLPLILCTCGGFLLAVLWMDLMFDVQVLNHTEPELPAPILDAIAAYYGRVTTSAKPMGHLVGVVMLVLLVTLVMETLQGRGAPWLVAAACVFAGGPILLAILRVYPNAVRLAARADNAVRQSALARSICRDHLLCFAGILSFVVVQLASA